MELTDFLEAGTNSYKLKGNWKFLVLHGKNGCDQSGHGTQKLAVSEHWTGGINFFLHVDTDSQKLKADLKVFGQAWSILGAASLVIVFQNWFYLKIH